MKKCNWWNIEVPENRKSYCSVECIKKYHQNTRKLIDPVGYRKRLNAQNKRHRDQVRQRLGLPLDTPCLNPTNGRGFKMKDGYKYLLLKDHPNVAKNGYIAEHVVIMTKELGRPLNGKETVHHINGIRDDNRIENLELWSHSHPPGQRVRDKIKWCKEFLSQYE